MCENFQVSIKEVKFFIFSAMIFAVCAALSIEFNDFFKEYILFGFNFSLNFSVVFFCLSYFIIDLVTELYSNRVADVFIYAKVVSQTLFILLGNLGIYFTDKTADSVIAKSFSLAPSVLLYFIIASILSYKLTGWMMQCSKVKYRGRFLFSRYLFSTLPGEVIFSLIFTLLSFSKGRSLSQVLTIFIDLIIVKFFLSLVFSLVIVPITNILRHYLGKQPEYERIDKLPLTDVGAN